MNDNVKTLIRWWILKGRTEQDPFYTFFIYYLCLDAWMVAESNKDSDSDKLEWLINTDNFLRKMWVEDGFAGKDINLNNLIDFSPIQDMRPNQNKEAKLEDINSFEQSIRFIYQIRCNLFHGSKDLMNDRDKQLVRFSGDILKRWIEWSFFKLNKV